MIYVHPFNDNLGDNFVFLSFDWSKTMEREKGREKIITSCEYERESCQKVVTKWLYKYHFSNNLSYLIMCIIQFGHMDESVNRFSLCYT
jgi:hypothetical protein